MTPSISSVGKLLCLLCLFMVVPGCGPLPCRAAAQPHLIVQVNEWQEDWPTFFARHRLQAQLDLIEKDYADREARELWSQLQVGTDVYSWGQGLSFSEPIAFVWGPLVEWSPGAELVKCGHIST